MDWAVNEWSVSGHPVIIVFDTVHSMAVGMQTTNDGVVTSINNTVKSIAYAASTMTAGAGFNVLASGAPDNANDPEGLAWDSATNARGLSFNFGTIKKLEPIV